MKGTIDFNYDFRNDVVVARPRWTLDTPVEVVRWYEVQSRYFKARFGGPKDLIVINHHFDVAPQLGTLWTCYCAKMLETFVRFAVHVKSSSHVQQTSTSSVLRYCISTVEVATLGEAVDAILELRQAAAAASSGSGARRHSSTQMPVLPGSTKLRA